TFGGDPARFVPHFPAALASIEEISLAVAGRGLISVDPERGVVRRLPLLATVGDTLMPALGLEMLRVAADAPALAVSVGMDRVRAVAGGGGGWGIWGCPPSVTDGCGSTTAAATRAASCRRRRCSRAESTQNASRIGSCSSE